MLCTNSFVRVAAWRRGGGTEPRGHDQPARDLFSAATQNSLDGHRTLGAMCEIRQCVRPGGGGEELLAEPCVSAHCSQTAVTGRQGRLE